MKNTGRIMKRAAAVLLACVTLITATGLWNLHTKAAETEGSIKVVASASEVMVNDTFTVEVTLDSPNGLTHALFCLGYDKKTVEYVSGAPQNGGDGKIVFDILGAATEQYQFKYTITFRAISAGNASFEIVDAAQFINTDVEDFVPAFGSASVKIWAIGSDDASLSSLSVAGKTLDPAFSPSVTQYRVYVDDKTTSVNITATTSQGGAHTINGNYSNLAYGENVITITAKAPRGNEMKYTIKVYREWPPTEPPTQAPTQPPTQAPTQPPTQPPTQAPTEPPVEVDVKVDGDDYVLSDMFEKDDVPAGFTKTEGMYQDKPVAVAYSKERNVTLYYLLTKDLMSGGFYVYDEAADDFTPYKIVVIKNTVYIPVNPNWSDEKPVNCAMTTVSFGNAQFSGYANPEQVEYVYFYARCEDGSYGWYCIDTKEVTIQRMHSYGVTETPTEPSPQNPTQEETTAPEIVPGDDQGMREQISSLEAANRELTKEIRFQSLLRILIIVIAGFVVVLLLILVLYFSGRAKRRIPQEPEKVITEDDGFEFVEIGENDDAADDDSAQDEDAASDDFIQDEDAVNHDATMDDQENEVTTEIIDEDPLPEDLSAELAAEVQLVMDGEPQKEAADEWTEGEE